MERLNLTVDEENKLEALYREFRILSNMLKIKSYDKVFIRGKNRIWTIQRKQVK